MGTATTREPHGAAAPTGRDVWRAIATAPYVVLSHVTPSGAPRSSGVIARAAAGRLYVATAPDSWKARHIARDGRVSVTVPVRRGGLLSLLLPIPPATISFHGVAVVHPAGSSHARSLTADLASLLPDERRDDSAVIEIQPLDDFVTFGLGVPLRRMRDPAASARRVPVDAGW